MAKSLRRAIAAIFCLALLCGTAVFAEESGAASTAQAGEMKAVVLQAGVDFDPAAGEASCKAQLDAALSQVAAYGMNAVLVDETVTVVAITLSGATEEVLWGVREARRRGARVVLMTASQDPQVLAQAEEVLPVASEEYLFAGLRISPQFPILVMTDLFFAYYLGSNEFFNRERYQRTMQAMLGEDPKGRERKG